MFITLFNLLPEWFIMHAPALCVVIPMIGATLSALFSSGRHVWFLSIITAGLTAICAVTTACNVLVNGTISYAMGGWMPPLGIEFRLDMLNMPIMLLIAVIGILAAIFSRPTLLKQIGDETHGLFYTAFLLCLAGHLGVVMTGDAFNLFVFLEISSLSAYALVAMGGQADRRALPAAFHYLIMGTLGASFFVTGVGFLYAITGSLNMVDIAERLGDVEGNRAVLAAFAFIVVGLGLKFAVFPLHQWLPNAYSYAPTFVTVFLAAVATKAGLYALIRFVFTVFSPDWFFVQWILTWLILPAGALGVLICSFQAVMQSDIRKMLAYSSVAQIGYMLLGIGVISIAGLSGALFHIVNHGLMKAALFMAVGGICMYYQSYKISDFAGVACKAPITMSGFAIAGLSLIGIPPLAGFMSKWILLQAVLEQGWLWAALVISVGSLLAFIYIGRVLETAFFRPVAAHHTNTKEAPVVILLPLWILAIANIYLGIWAGEVIPWFNDAAGLVLGMGGVG